MIAPTVTATYQTLVLEADGEVLTVTISRPDALNALSHQVLTELADLLRRVAAQSSYAFRGMIIIGAGQRAFVAGADIREMAIMTPDEGEAFGALGQEVTELLEAVPIPVVAAVNGFALGGGCELAMACDYAYCTENAIFGQPEVALGLIPGFGGCVRLQRLVGPGRAKEMIYTGRRVDAAEALRIGLVSAVFPTRESMIEAAHASLALVAERSPVAVSLCKEAIGGMYGLTTSEALALERQAFRRAFLTEDMREGTSSFLGKRAPSYPGR
jgi:enoyl-CoA hydratase